MAVFPIEQGGTGANNAADARSNLGIVDFPDDDRVIEIVDHYFQSTIPANTPIGSLGLVATLSGATVSPVSVFNAVNSGIIAIDTGAVATNHGVFRTAPASILFGSALYRFKAIARLADISSATQSYSSNIGFGDATAGNSAIVDGARFFHDQNSANWFAITTSNSVSTTTNTGIVIDPNTFSTLEIEVNKLATEIKYFVNGVLVATHTTNIPSGAGRQTGINLSIQKTVGTTQRQLQLDYTKLRIDSR